MICAPGDRSGEAAANVRLVNPLQIRNILSIYPCMTLDVFRDFIKKGGSHTEIFYIQSINNSFLGINSHEKDKL